MHDGGEFFLRPGIVLTIVENYCITFPVLRLFCRIDASVKTIFIHEVVIREVVVRRWRNTWIGEISIGIIGRGLNPHTVNQWMKIADMGGTDIPWGHRYRNATACLRKQAHPTRSIQPSARSTPHLL
jgi:hypothetical protein